MLRRRLASVVLLALFGAAGAAVSALSSSEGPRLGTARAFHTATRLADGRILIAGGMNIKAGVLGTAEVLNAAANRVESQLALREPRYGHVAVALRDGRVLIAGGMGSANRALASAELFDPATRTFRSVGPMAAARFRHAAALLPDGTVLVVGGRAGSVILGSSERFDPVTERFLPDASLPSPLFEHTATALPDGRVAIVGGTAVVDGFSRPLFLYDPSQREFRPWGDLPAWLHATALFGDGQMGVFGGGWETAFVVDPAVPGKRITLEPAVGVFGLTATSLPDGTVLTGGGYAFTYTFSGAVVLWRSTSTSPVASGEMRLPRAAHTATVLTDGRVLMAGGNTRSGVTDRTEILSSK